MFFKKYLKSYFIKRNKIVSSKDFQRKANNFFISRFFVKSDGKKIYDLISGFIYSQTLLAFVELGLFEKLLVNDCTISQLSEDLNLSKERVNLLCKSGVAIGILENVGNSYILTRIGAAIVGVPGLQKMISHHKIFYQDLFDPVKLLKGDFETKMSKFWPYVLNNFQSEKEKKENFEISKIYSDLMASSQILVAEETLGIVSFHKSKHLLDIGGGTGTFLGKVKESYPGLKVSLFDLKNVVGQIKEEEKKKKSINEIIPGNFLEDEIPQVADTISLVRVLYDHDDHIAEKILRNVYKALPNNGSLIISEPMSGGKKPTKAGDCYFGFYTLAMSTGRPRDKIMHFNLLKKAGFQKLKKHKSKRDFITGIITAKKIM